LGAVQWAQFQPKNRVSAEISDKPGSFRIFRMVIFFGKILFFEIYLVGSYHTTNIFSPGVRKWPKSFFVIAAKIETNLLMQVHFFGDMIEGTFKRLQMYA